MSSRLYQTMAMKFVFVPLVMHPPVKVISGKPVNAAGVLQIPLAVFVWDDGYGISVPKKYQTTKGSISEALKGNAERRGH